MISRRLVVSLASVSTVTCALVAAAPLTVVDPGQGPVTLSKGTTAAAELSGIAWTGGASWLAVGDNGAKALWQVEASIETATGRILASTVSGSIAAPTLGSDSEGIAYRPDVGSVYVSDEVASAITGVALPGGGPAPSVAVPAIYAPANVQSNMGLESLAWSGSTLWTANEETLVPDGVISTTTAGSLVRVQRFDAAGSPSGQWAYRTDPISAMNPFITQERSGVVDIVTWSATTLLVLERELGGAVVPTFRSRLYEVDVSGASDVSSVASLLDPGVTPLTKTLLWERSFAAANFEGMSWGPAAGGGRSLVLVSDNGGGLNQNLYALVVVPEPGTTLLAAAAAAATAFLGTLRRAGRTGPAPSAYHGKAFRARRPVTPETRMARGDRLAVERRLAGTTVTYLHHGIDMGDGTVIHARPDDPERIFGGGRVARTSQEEFAAGGTPRVVTDPPARHAPEEIARRAESLEGRDGYCPVVENCEHFATWCATGQRQSRQVDLLVERVGRTATRVAAVVAARSAGRVAIRTGLGTTVRFGLRTLLPATFVAEGAAAATEWTAHQAGHSPTRSRMAGESAGLVTSAAVCAAGTIAAGPAAALAAGFAGAALWLGGSAAAEIASRAGSRGFRDVKRRLG